MRTIQLTKRMVRDDWGGTETVIFETTQRLVAKGHPSEVFCTRASANSTEEYLKGLRIRRFSSFYPYIGLKPGARAILDKKGGSPISFPMMRALKQEPELDLIHLHTGNRLGGMGRLVARQRRIPYVISLHGGAFDIPQAEAESMAAPTKGAFDYGKVLGLWVGARKVLSEASAILCVGYPESLLAMERMPGKRVVYLPNGADTRRFGEGDGAGFRRARGIPEDAFVLLTLARIDSQKNQLLPVRMLPELLKREPKAHVLLVGSVTNTAYHDQVVRAAEELGVREHLTVIPGIPSDSPDLASAYHAANLFVLPSIHEPFGIVILEAWSAGLPAIASRIGGIPHFVEDGVDGLLFDPADEASFLGAFEGVVGNPALSRSLSERGRKKARERYDWDVITERLIGVYEDAIRENFIRQ